jgi:hypothetical protein
MHKIRKDGWFYRFAYSWHRQSKRTDQKSYVCEVIFFAGASLIAYVILAITVAVIVVSVGTAAGVCLYTGFRVLGMLIGPVLETPVNLGYVRESSVVLLTIAPAIVLWTGLGRYFTDVMRKAAKNVVDGVHKIKNKRCAQVQIV